MKRRFLLLMMTALLSVGAIQQVKGSKSQVESYYNLNGQRVAQPTKGVYIVNGKKIIIK